jgi:hypothetical protein
MQLEEEKHSFLNDKNLYQGETAHISDKKHILGQKWRLSQKPLLIFLLISWLTLISLTCSGVVVYLLTLRQSPVPVTPTGETWTSKGHTYGCGSSVTEAKSLGCIFDTMSFIWVHPACYDRELTTEFETARDWKWYTEYHGESGNGELISMDDIRTGEFDAWVPWEFHTVHCTFQWRKMHRALMGGLPLDSYLAAYNHTIHCEMMLQKGEWWGNDQVNTHIGRQFTTCGYGGF